MVVQNRNTLWNCKQYYIYNTDLYISYVKILCVTKLKLQNKANPQRNNHREYITLQSIQTKLRENNVMVTPADKGNSVIVLPTQQYNTKIQNFIDKNNFQTSTVNPTKTFQNQIKKTVNSSTTLIMQDFKWKFINLNPSAPTLNSLIKIHKPEQSIRLYVLS